MKKFGGRVIRKKHQGNIQGIPPSRAPGVTSFGFVGLPFD